MMTDVERVKSNIRNIISRKLVASNALCRYYSARALETFRRFQGFNSFWENRTNSAYNLVSAEAIKADNEIGFLLAHHVEYGVYLELANDRKHEALWPIIRDLDSQFEIDLRKIWE